MIVNHLYPPCVIVSCFVSVCFPPLLSCTTKKFNSNLISIHWNDAKRRETQLWVNGPKSCAPFSKKWVIFHSVFIEFDSMEFKFELNSLVVHLIKQFTFSIEFYFFSTAPQLAWVLLFRLPYLSFALYTISLVYPLFLSIYAHTKHMEKTTNSILLTLDSTDARKWKQ